MHGLILAGGEGSRLAASGVTLPKPLVVVGGKPQVVRLTAVMRELGCDTTTVLVRDTVAGQVRAALRAPATSAIRVESCATPSSLHTLALGLAHIPAGPVFCSMVDTVMRPADWTRVGSSVRARLASGRDLVLVVTPRVEDESPLWVRRNAAGDAVWLGEEAVVPPCVTGGAYGFSAASRALVGAALAQGLSRMRRFLAWLAERGVRIGTVEVEEVVDLDQRSDLLAAEQLLGSGPRGAVP